VTIPDDFVTLSQSSASLAGSLVTICEYVLFYASLAHTIDFFIKFSQYKTNTFDSGEVILLFFKVIHCCLWQKICFFY
jgi:hypothetical protein